MEGMYYFCCMRTLSDFEYINFNISELKTPVLSLSVRILIGSSDSDPSISDYIEKKSKSVGKSLNLSMSTLTFSKQSKNSSSNVSRDNWRPASRLEMAKLYSVGTEYIPNYW